MLVQLFLDRSAKQVYVPPPCVFSKGKICKLNNASVSRDVIISLGVNPKSMHSHRRDIVSHCIR